MSENVTAQTLPSEQRLLLYSVYGALAVAGMAIAWGVLGNSKVILFDGVYSLISVALSSLSLWSAKYIRKRDAERFPFGKEMMEPMVILGKFVVITLLCLFALFSGVSSLITGGQQVDPVSGMLYSAIASVACLAVYLYFRKKLGLLKSGFVEAEAQQWLMDFYLSLAVFLGFGAAYALGFTPYQHFIPYTDPVLVILVSVYLLKVPLVSIGKQMREVLDMAADDHYTLRIEGIVESIEHKYGFEESFTRVAKSGPKLFIEIDFVVAAGSWEPSLAEQDAIREEIMLQMRDFSLQKWLNVAFTADRKWAV